MNRLVWLFQAHHDLFAEAQRLQLEITELRAALIDSERRALEGGSAEITDMLKQYQEEYLSDRPYSGQIPDEVWLTPGENDRRERPD